MRGGAKVCGSMFPPSLTRSLMHSLSPLSTKAGDLWQMLAARLMLAFMRIGRVQLSKGGLKFVPERADISLGGPPDVSALHQLLAVVKTISLFFLCVESSRSPGTWCPVTAAESLLLNTSWV